MCAVHADNPVWFPVPTLGISQLPVIGAPEDPTPSDGLHRH